MLMCDGRPIYVLVDGHRPLYWTAGHLSKCALEKAETESQKVNWQEKHWHKRKSD